VPVGQARSSPELELLRRYAPRNDILQKSKLRYLFVNFNAALDWQKKRLDSRD
jgi:hypothetical protein